MAADGQEWVPHGAYCICFRCRTRRRRLAREATIQERVLVRSDRAAAHIAELVAGGMTRAEVARAARLSKAVVSKAGRRGESISEETERKILNVADRGAAKR